MLRLRQLALSRGLPLFAFLFAACLGCSQVEAQVQIGNKPYVTILVRFSDLTNVTPNPKSYYEGLMSNSYPGMGHYWREVSFNQMNIDGSIVVGWYNLPHDRAYYAADNITGYDGVKITLDATAVADADVDFSKFAGINVFINYAYNGYSTGGAGVQYTLDGVTRFWQTTLEAPVHNQGTLAHEMGHSLGWLHSSGPTGTSNTSKWDVMSLGGNAAVAPYGTTALGTIAYNKDKAGWIPRSRKYIPDSNTTRTISIERLSNPVRTDNFLMAQIFYGGWATRFYTVEARMRSGYDGDGLPGECILIHKVDSLAEQPQARVVDADGNGDPNDAGAMWLPGETFTDAQYGISISIVSKDATGFTLSISNGNNPTPNIVTNTNDDGPGSLRNAIGYANAVPGTTVKFNIPATDAGYSQGVFTIRPLSALPQINGAGTVIDGATQAAFGGNTNTAGPEILLDGGSAGAGADGLRLASSGCIIRELAIGNFASNGISLWGAQVTGNTILGCYIGTNAAGSAALPNGFAGVSLGNGATANHVGNPALGAGNLISGNAFPGISINSTGTENNVIQGNLIGTDRTGTASLPNRGSGVNLYDGPRNNLIGGAAPAERNVISGNVSWGVALVKVSANAVRGNLIGVDVSGVRALANSSAGIGVFQNASANTIGGNGDGEGNVIGGNGSHGISLFDAETAGNVILGNRIGLSADGTTNLPNAGAGIAISGGAHANVIGGIDAGSANVIVSNNSEGIVLSSTAGNGNTLRGNRIWGNKRLPINLNGGQEDTYGVTANDPSDGDSGPNNLQNFPAITKIVLSGGIATVTGTINSTPSTTVAIDLYRISAARRDASFHGGAEEMLSSVNVTTSAAGQAAFTFQVVGVAAGDILTTTATNADTGDTSEFGADATSPPATTALTGLTLSPDTVTESEKSTGTVTLSDPAPAGGAAVALSSSNSSVASTPATVLLPEGAKSGAFVVNTVYVSATTTVSISASFGGVTKSATLTVKKAGVASVTVSPTSVVGGNAATGTVRLDIPAPIGGAQVMLSTDKPDVTATPSSITVPAGAQEATFNISSVGVETNTQVSIGASWNGISKNAVLTVTPADLVSLTLSSPSVTGGLKVIGTVKLNGAAPPNGRSVALSTDNNAASVPASVLVPAGLYSATFTVGTNPVLAKTNATLTASARSVTKTASLTVRPYNPADLTGDGLSDLLLQNQSSTDRRIAIQTLNGRVVVTSGSISPVLPMNWQAVGVGDFDRDLRNEIVVQNSVTREISLIYMEGRTIRSISAVYPTLPEGWQVKACADINRDGVADIIVQNVNNQRIAVLLMDNAKMLASRPFTFALQPGWSVVGAADFNADGQPDLVVQNPATRQISILTLNPASYLNYLASIPLLPSILPDWIVGAVGDFNDDGKPDLVVQNTATRQISILVIIDRKVNQSLSVSPIPIEGWKLVGPR